MPKNVCFSPVFDGLFDFCSLYTGASLQGAALLNQNVSEKKSKLRTMGHLFIHKFILKRWPISPSAGLATFLLNTYT